MTKVSVIMPVYNVENYLVECLNSVINQTLRDIEIICIDDGSTDNSGKILDEYAANDSRIKVIHKKNGGYGVAMNIGIDTATGEYIGIVEPDDYIEPNMYEILYNKAIETNVDFVKSDFFKFSENLIQNIVPLDYSGNYYNRIINPRKEKFIFNIGMNTWTGIYKTEFIKNNNIRYNETPGARYQDQGFWFQTFMYAKAAYIMNCPFYHYRFFETNSTNNPNGFEWIQAEYRYIFDILNKNNEFRTIFLPIYTRFKFKNYLFNYRKLTRKDKRIKLKTFRNIFIEEMNNGDIDISGLNSDEKNLYDLLIKKPNKFYRKVTNSLTLFQKLFSVKKQNYHKIIRLLGFKIKIKSKKLEELERLKRIEQKLDKLSYKISLLESK